MKAKVLIFIDWFLPGYQAGGPVTSVTNLLAHLNKDFQFFIITRNTDYCETEPYKDIIPDSWVSFSENVSVWYISPKNISKKSIQSVAEKVQADTWYITGVYSRYFSILPARISKKLSPNKIVAPRGMFSSHALEVKSFKKKLFIYVSRSMGLYNQLTFHATNEEERGSISKLFPKNKIVTIPNLPKQIVKQENLPVKKKKGTLRLCSLTRIAPEKNTLGALKILKSFGERNSGSDYSIEYDIYGHLYNKEYWEECLTVVSSLPSQIHVNYHGSIHPEFISDVLGKSHFLFLPTMGENFGHAILESLSLGRPVIISDQTPWKKLEEKGAGWDIPLQNIERYTSVLKECLEMNQECYDNMSDTSKRVYNAEAGIDQSRNDYIKLFGNE